MYTPLTRLGAGVATPHSLSSTTTPASTSTSTPSIYSIMGGLGLGLVGQSQNVLAAFRDLKARAKALEMEQKEIRRGADEVRSQLSMSRRESFKFTKSPQEVKQMDSMMRLRKETEERRRQVNELERDLMVLEDASRSLERGVTSARARLASLDDDTLQTNSILRQHEQEMGHLLEELRAREASCKQLSKQILALPKAKQLQTSRMKEAVASMSSEVQKVRSATDQSKLRSAGISKYIEMMIGVNGEMCDTILAREEAKTKFLRIAEKMSPPEGGGGMPSYTGDVLSAISKRHADSALESETRKAVADARSLLKMHSALYSDIQPNNPTPTSSASSTKQSKVRSKAGDQRKTKNRNFIDLLSPDVEAIVESSRIFARRAIAAANLHSPSTNVETPRNTPLDIAFSGGTKRSPVFIGGGGTDSKNAYASVSRSVRNAKEWNQQIASHIRSMENRGVSRR